MTPSDIPGYAYDSATKRYFKISRNDIPNFVTQQQVNSSVVKEEIDRKVVRLSGVCSVDPRLESTGLNYHLNNRECFWKSTGVSVYRDLGLAYARKFRYKQGFVQDFGKTIVSPDGYWLHSIHENFLESFQISWESNVRACGQLRGKFRLTKRNVLSMDWHPGFTPKDITWIEPGRSFAIVGSFGRCTGVLFLDCTRGVRFFHPLRTIPMGSMAPIKFATAPDCLDAECCNATHQPRIDITMEDDDDQVQGNYSNVEPRCKFVVFAGKRISVYSNGHSAAQLANKVQQVPITACAMAEPVRIAQSTIPLVYLAASNRPLELTNLSEKPLIKFRTTSGAPKRMKGRDFQITSLKVVLTPTGDRCGILVGRHCGLLQLWDDRWPTLPAVQYPESEASSNLSALAHHIPVQPVVGQLFHCNSSVVACPLLGSSCIALWQLSTGRPLNVLQVPSTAKAQLSAPPPQVFLRSTWPDVNGIPTRGPAVMSVEQCALNCFTTDNATD